MNKTNRTFTIVMLILIACAAWVGWTFAGNRPTSAQTTGQALVRLSPADAENRATGEARPAPLMARAAPMTTEPLSTPSIFTSVATPGHAPADSAPPTTANDTAWLTRLTLPAGTILQHRVERGESLKRIAARYRVTTDFIAALNNLANRHHIQMGSTLKVVQGPFRAVVSKGTFRLQLLLGDLSVGAFSVGLGANNSTPNGEWRVKDKLSNPAWVNPVTRQRFAADDPSNPIGEHWLGLEGLSGDAIGKLGFGVHGTVEPESIGRNASLGCVRMLPADVAVVFQALVEGASTVSIQ